MVVLLSLVYNQGLALYHAIKEGDLEVVQRLVTNGASVNWRNPFNVSHSFNP